MQKNDAKRIAEKILEQPDRVGTLWEVVGELPSELVSWFLGMLKAHISSKSYVEIDLAQNILANTIIPGDLVVRKNRDPKVGDLVEAYLRAEEGYTSHYVIVLKVNVKEGTLFVQDPLNKENEGIVGIQNVVSVIEKIISFGSEDWKRITSVLNIDCDLIDIKKWVKENIEYLEKSKQFYKKEENLKLLKERLKQVSR